MGRWLWRYDYHDSVFNLLVACARLTWGILLLPMGQGLQEYLSFGVPIHPGTPDDAWAALATPPCVVAAVTALGKPPHDYR